MKHPAIARRGALALLAASLAAPAWAQGDKPIRLVVPLTTGSTVDTLARAMGPTLAKVTGHAVVVENLPGAGGMTGTLQVVNGAKDGTVLGMVSSNHVINPGIYKKMPFDAIADITPIRVIGSVPLVLVLHPSVPAHTTSELIALMKARPGALNLGSAGNGSTLHLAGELFGQEAGVQIRHIPYRGTGPLTTDLLGGQVDMAFVSVTAVAPHIKAGKLRAIALSSTTRSALLPEVPTLAEFGLPRYGFDAWIAVVGPAGMAPAVVHKTAADLQAVLASKEVADALAAQGIVTVQNSPEQALPFFKAELEKHLRLVKASGASVD
ncbi:hypothetical protein GCM10007320_46040 [Pseudorhodoferax aquiterrae]|uniref:Tripartite tricarboxylate transporter substrate binding protein n=1 Tax=Pseudorhodoferax aquiterrae TaxID=747304 RepID=A0ABQ3G887_9BURK|nr:tripartite tricarboxylate transporter substrate binding protein [Pseudorhodoferax aquiterrae]GHC94266.1 hypothetical protein GCM10007320_46040 [Pseudorhodoferax aquiterrae]